MQQHQLGQYQYPGAYPAGAYYATPQIDPLVYAGLESAGQVLKTNDPGAPETMTLIERIIAAPPLFPSATTGTISPPRKLSDLNPILRPVVFVRENPGFTILAALSIPVFIFLLGRQAGMRAKR